jgi:KAP family P-loop domain
MANVTADGPRSSHREAFANEIRENAGRGGSYFLLNDQPVEDSGEDLLGMSGAAADIASVLESSIESSPFVLAVDAGWGMGKSTLLHQIEYQLRNKPGIINLHFNAWTSEGMDTLEGLIKAVLGKLDRNALRRGVRWLAQQRSVLIVARVASGLAARFLGVPRLVDDLWSQMNVDAKSRNELRDLIQTMMSKWISADGKRDPNRALMVFIDDLDRCSDDSVVKVCEAVKLYLDVPGLIFVMACDQSVLARGVSLPARGDADNGRAYLEKIVQVAYRMRPPEELQIKKFIQACARQSGTYELFDETVTSILAEGTGRNPRRIKRIINSFVLEYCLDPAWRQPPLGSTLLVTAVLLQHLYTQFYELLVSEESSIDPIGEFLDYVQVHEKVSDIPPDDDAWWEIYRRSFQEHRLQLPEELPKQAERLTAELERLERQLPADFPVLARNPAFIRLLRHVGKEGAGEALHSQLLHSPLSTAPVRESLAAKITYQDQAFGMLMRSPRHNEVLTSLIRASTIDNFRIIPLVGVPSYLMFLEKAIAHSDGYEGIQRKPLSWFREVGGGAYLSDLKRRNMRYKKRLIIIDETDKAQMEFDLADASTLDYYWSHTGAVATYWITSRDFLANFPGMSTIPRDLALFDRELLIAYDEQAMMVTFDVLDTASALNQLFDSLDQLERNSVEFFHELPMPIEFSK